VRFEHDLSLKPVRPSRIRSYRGRAAPICRISATVVGAAGGEPDSNIGGLEPTSPARSNDRPEGLRSAAPSFTVIRVMLFTADTMFTLICGGTSAQNASRWPQAPVAEHTNDAASGV
jgi:hypothetical protein